MKRYVTLFVVSLVIAVGLATFLKRPRTLAPRPIAASIPEVTLRLTIQRGAVMPTRAAVPKNHRVRLQVLNRDLASVTLALAGYEDRLGTHAIGAGAMWDTSFVADRPGDGFAWLVEGKPAGQLSVSGSHLEEGHR
jgi:hypothetical protein